MVRFVKVDELKLTKIELFSFFHFKKVTANAPELFCVVLKTSNERFL